MKSITLFTLKLWISFFSSHFSLLILASISGSCMQQLSLCCTHNDNFGFYTFLFYYYLEFLGKMRSCHLFLLSHLFIFSTVYLYPYELIDIYLSMSYNPMLSLFILLLKLFQLWTIQLVTSFTLASVSFWHALIFFPLQCSFNS